MGPPSGSHTLGLDNWVLFDVAALGIEAGPFLSSAWIFRYAFSMPWKRPTAPGLRPRGRAGGIRQGRWLRTQRSHDELSRVLVRVHRI